MKLALAIVFALLVATVFISGCVQQTPAGGETGGKMTASQMEQQAANTLEQEMDQAIGNMTLEDLENELLTQG